MFLFLTAFFCGHFEMANLTVNGLYFSLETEIVTFYGEFPI